MSNNEAAAAGSPSQAAPPASDAHDDDAGESELNTIDMNLHSPAHHPQQSSFRLHTPTHSVIDEDSNRYFMSEPSFSEDGDASSGQVIRAPHRARLFGRHNSSDEDEQPHRMRGRRQRSPYRSAPSSPGNTSLSSWDSPAPGRVKNLIQFHFAPPTLPSGDNMVSTSANNSYNPRYLPPPASHNQPESAAAEDRKLPPMPQPPPHRQPSAETTDEDSYFLRQLHYATSKEAEEARVPESFVLHDLQEPLVPNYHLQHRHVSGAAADESIAMTLSDSSGDDEDDDNNDKEDDKDTGKDYDKNANLEWPSLSPSNVSGSTTGGGNNASGTAGKSRPQPLIKQRIIQRPSKQAASQQRQPQATSAYKDHRRARNASAAATKTAASRQEYKNMRSNKIYMPTQEDDDGDDEDDKTPPPSSHRKPDVIARRTSRGQQRWTMNGPSQHGAPMESLDRQQQSAQQTAEQAMLIRNALSQDSGYYGTLSHQLPQRSGQADVPVASWPPKMLPLPPTSFVGPSIPISYQYNRNWPSVAGEGSASGGPIAMVSGSEDGDDYALSYESNDASAKAPPVHVQFAPSATHFHLDKANGDVENPRYRETIRQGGSSNSPFANIGKKSAEKAKRATFLPQSSFAEQDGKNYHFYICPVCKTRQREFFTVNDAPRQLEGPGSYLALYFSIYVISSLFIFGLEEGWETGDCIYFAVVTLTTAGLGDFVPTSSANKIICSIFIYFGVACIGLLLGTYIAGMLDDRARRDRKDKLIESCPNCARLQTIKEASCRSTRHYSIAAPISSAGQPKLQKYSSERRIDTKFDHTAILADENRQRQPTKSSSSHGGSEIDASPQGTDSHRPRMQKLSGSPTGRSPEQTVSSGSESISLAHAVGATSGASPASSTSKSSYHIGSPITRNILDRQGRTRHDSIDFSNLLVSTSGTPVRERRLSHDNIQTPTIIESLPLENDRTDEWLDNDEDSCSEDESFSTTDEIVDETVSKVKAIQYVFLTLRQALVNSMVIIAVGCFGFWIIEGFSVIDSWYFTTVFLTTVGYGDIVPVTRGGKLFATVYILVAGTILLNNMSSISMIPIELRKRRIERAVLTQFGDELDDAALRELATGPLIQRLRLSANRPDGLDECTREMFSLAMLVRLGKVSETDIRETFAAFRRLDVNNEGILNSKSIIAAIIQKRTGINASTSMSNLQEAAASSSSASRPMPTGSSSRSSRDRPVYWLGKKGSLHVDTPTGEFTFEDAEEIRRSSEHAPLLR